MPPSTITSTAARTPARPRPATLLPPPLESRRGAVPVVDSLEVPGLGVAAAGAGVEDLRAARQI